MIARLLPQAASYAGDIDWLFTLILVTVGFWFVVAEGVFLWLILRFRRKQGTRASYITGTLPSEKRWLTVPHVLVIVCDIVLIAGTMYVWASVKQELPTAETTVRVVAQQWAWTFQHPGPDGKLDTGDDVTTIDELHVELGKVHHFQLVSKDVVHSLSIPAFRLKQDAVPGRTITGWFTPTQVGQYDVQCAEICGIGHGLMPARIVVETSDQHREWLGRQRT